MLKVESAPRALALILCSFTLRYWRSLCRVCTHGDGLMLWISSLCFRHLTRDEWACSYLDRPFHVLMSCGGTARRIQIRALTNKFSSSGSAGTLCDAVRLPPVHAYVSFAPLLSHYYPHSPQRIDSTTHRSNQCHHATRPRR